MRVGLIVLALVALLPSAVRAGTYTVDGCDGSAFTPIGSSPPFSFVNDCEEEFVGLSASPGAFVPFNASASWTLSTPPGTSLRTLSADRWLVRDAPGWNLAVRTSEGDVLETCDDAGTCSDGGVSMPKVVTYDGLRTRSVSFGMRCVSVAGCSSTGSLPYVWLHVYRVMAIIDDPDPPQLTGPTGTLTTGWHRGTGTLAIAASDASGISRLALTRGQRAIGQTTPACDFTHMRPCPSAATVAATIDTSALPDGAQTLTATAADAAGQLRSGPVVVQVDQHAPAAPDSVSATRSADGTLTVSWNNADQGVAAPIAAVHTAVCNPGCADPTRVAADGIERLAGLRLPATGSLRLWLEDAAGNADPANFAAVTADAVQSTVPGAAPAPSPRLKISSVRRSGSMLTVSGRIARGATARVTAELTRSRSGKVVVRGRGRPNRGHWSVKIRLTHALRRSHVIYMTVRFAGQTTYRAETATRRLGR